MLSILHSTFASLINWVEKIQLWVELWMRWSKIRLYRSSVLLKRWFCGIYMFRRYLDDRFSFKGNFKIVNMTISDSFVPSFWRKKTNEPFIVTFWHDSYIRNDTKLHKLTNNTFNGILLWENSFENLNFPKNSLKICKNPKN